MGARSKVSRSRSSRRAFGGPGVYVFDLANGTFEKISEFSPNYGVWSPEGAWLAYRKYHAEVRAFEFASRKETEILDGSGVVGADLLGWTKEGLITVALVPDRAPPRVEAFRADGEATRTRDTRPALIRSFEVEGRLSFWLTRLDGGGLRQIPLAEGEHLFYRAWFPRRDHFIAERLDPAHSVYTPAVFSKRGHVEYAIEKFNFATTDVDSAGHWILGYKSYDDGHSVLDAEICIVRTDGAVSDSLTATPETHEDVDAKFSPTRAEIACVDDEGRIWIYEISEK